MNCSEYLVDYLIKRGVTDVFGYAGGYIVPFMDALYKRRDEIKTHVCYNEQGCALAAVGYARTSGRIGVYFTTSGPGAVNGLSGLADAWFDSFPVMGICGNVPTNEMKGFSGIRQNGFQEMDLVSMTRNISKYSVTANTSQGFADIVSRAYSMATLGRKGGLSLIFHSTYNKPILLVGNGVRSSGAINMVHEFIKKTNIPLLTTLNGVDLAQDDMHIGFIGTHGNRVANMILNECDLIIAVGARLGIRQVGRDASTFAPKADLVRADIDEYELSRDIKQNEKKYHTDARDFMRLLLSENIGDFSVWRNQCLEAKAFLEKYDVQPGNLAIKKISFLLPQNPIVAIDVGMNQCWAAQSLHLKGYEGRIHIGGGFGAMGCGLPYAIGSSICTDNGRVFCICGDGGFQMNIQELETVKRENLPIKIFILNNRVLGKISETQHFNHGDRFANTAKSGGYTVPNFKKISEAYGIKAASLSSYEELDSYKDWIEDKEPCLFDISLPEESFLTPKIKFETGVISPRLDDNVFNTAKEILAG